MKTMISTTHLVAAAVIAGAFAVGFFSGPALAGEPKPDATPFKFEFDFKPSELASTPMAKKMLSRLEREVRAYCGDGNRKMSLSERELVRACVNQTMSDSIAKFGSATVAVVYRSRADG